MKRILTLFITALMLFSITVSAAPVYTDNVANLLSELSIMQGDPDGNMRYDDKVSRAECTKIVVAASSYRNSVATAIKSSPFKDVTHTHWASPYVTVGVKNGLCKGYLDATFRPSNSVLYEEAATMFLRVLGYTDEDFGSSWPDGQVGIAKNIGLLDNIDKSIGQELTRRDMAKMVYNMLTIKPKGSQSAYLSTFDRTIVDDVVLISTINEDPSIAEGKIFTSSGTYNVADTLDISNIGKRGSMVLRNGDTVVSFIPDGTSSGGDQHMVYSALGNGIVTYKNGSFNKIDVNDDTVFYKDSNKVSASAAISSLQMGDVLRVTYKSNGEIDYIMCTKGSTIGPETVKSSEWYTEFGADSNVAVIRDGVKSTISDVKTDDIAYYVKELGVAFVYSKKVTGIYESATPNKDAPTSVTVSGVTYKLEGVNAFSKLSSNGSFELGDTITLLLGKSGDIADVKTDSQINENVIGFLSSVGTKQTTVSGTAVTKPYVKVVVPSGEEREYITEKNYESLLNSAVSVKLDGGIATLTRISEDYGISGKFIWGTRANRIGSAAVADDVKIIETSTINSNESSIVASVYPQRLNGITISESNILYVSKNSEGQIDAMILNDTTGDTYNYGIVTSAKNNSSNFSVSGKYEYISSGVSSSLSTQNKIFSVSTGDAVKIKTDGKSVLSMAPLNKVSSSKITNVNGFTITLDGKTYTMSDKVQIYVRKSNISTTYNMITIDQLKDMAKDYQASVFIDDPNSSGGRVRVIILS